jgi:hypothetical protein
MTSRIPSLGAGSAAFELEGRDGGVDDAQRGDAAHTQLGSTTSSACGPNLGQGRVSRLRPIGVISPIARRLGERADTDRPELCSRRRRETTRDR